MIYSFSGGGVPQDSLRPFPEIIEPARFDIHKIKFANVADTMVPNAVAIGEAYSSGFRLDTSYLPKKVKLSEPSWLIDFDLVAGALQIVSTRARHLLEEFDPGTHQFEHIEYVDPNGEHIADMWLMIVCRRLDTVDRQTTTGMTLSPHVWTDNKTLARLKPHLIEPDTNLNTPPKLAFSESRIGEAHIWRDKHLIDRQFMSDALIKAVDAAQLMGLGRSVMVSVS